MYLNITNGNVYAWRVGDSLRDFVRIRFRLAMLSFCYGVVVVWVFFLGRGLLYYMLGVIIFYYFWVLGVTGKEML
jgi:hypothetical protein